MRKFIVIGLIGFMLTGKSFAFSDYLEEINEKAKEVSQEKVKSEVKKIIEKEKKKAVLEVKRTQSLYEQEKKSLMVKMIKNPPTPIKTPEKILRVLILPYVDEQQVLHTQSFSFIKVDEGSWILGDYLLKEGKIVNRKLTPLGEGN